MSASTVTSLDGFHATRSAQRADELVRAYFDAVNAEDPARIDELLARQFLSYDGSRSRTASSATTRTFGDTRRARASVREGDPAHGIRRRGRDR